MKNFLFAIFFVGRAFASEPIELAITVDDLPASGVEHPTMSRTHVAKQFIDVFKHHKVPGVYGFMNGILAQHMEERLKILESWKKAGFDLGNHTFSHKDLAKISAQEYIEDIEKNESMLIDYASEIEELKYFRYPYLSEGDSSEKRYAVRSYLAKRKYKIAPVSIDFEDWQFGPPYVRCSKKKDDKEIKHLEDLYLEKAVQRFKYSVELAKRIYGHGRKIKHILLLHMTPMTGHMLDELLNAYEKEGVKYVSFENAAKDTVYVEDTGFIDVIGKGYFMQAADARKLKWPDLPPPQIPVGELEKMCN